MDENVVFLQRYLYKDLTTGEIETRIHAANRAEQERKEFLKTVKFREKIPVCVIQKKRQG